MTKKEMLLALLTVGFVSLGLISPILAGEEKKFHTIFEGQGLKGSTVKLAKVYGVIVRAENVLVLSENGKGVDRVFCSVESVIEPDTYKTIDKKVVICGFKNKKNDEVTYLFLDNQSGYDFDCRYSLNDEFYDQMMEKIEEEKRKKSNNNIEQNIN